MDNRPLATSSYKEALKLDVYCFEAFDLLTSHHMLTAQEGEADLWCDHVTIIFLLIDVILLQLYIYMSCSCLSSNRERIS